MVVERREAQRARSRRFAQADRSVARATPEGKRSFDRTLQGLW